MFKSKKYIIKGECFVRGGAKATGSGQKFPSTGDPDLRLNLKQYSIEYNPPEKQLQSKMLNTLTNAFVVEKLMVENGFLSELSYS